LERVFSIWDCGQQINNNSRPGLMVLFVETGLACESDVQLSAVEYRRNDVWQYIWPVSFAAVIVVGWLLRNEQTWNNGRNYLFPAMLFPMLGFFSLYTFVYTFVADHYQYLACIGPIAIAAGISATVYRRSGENTKFIIASAAGVLLITLGVLTWRQCGIYKDRIRSGLIHWRRTRIRGWRTGT